MRAVQWRSTVINYIAALILTICTILQTGCTQLSVAASQPKQLELLDQLTPEEEKQAGDLAEQAVTVKGLRTTGKLYVVEKELYRDKEAEEAGTRERKALVTHYRYEGDVGILTIVNLTKNQVMNVESVPHLATPFAPEEYELARKLGLAHPDVKEALAPYRERVTVEGLVTRTSAKEDPLYAHRVISLLFKIGDDYLSGPMVTVDLTTETVVVEKKRATDMRRDSKIR
jgi:Cu2+-containing amine oxidase